MLLLALLAAPLLSAPLVVEAESFRYPGGWVVDSQFIDQMGSSYLLAHGMGTPVADARTELRIDKPGRYRVWVRTKDWVAQFNAPGAPGRFQLLIAGKPLPTTFGTAGAEWHWQDGGVVTLPAGNVALALHDLTGFEGRCDAIAFTPESAPAPTQWRPTPAAPKVARFDLVIVGGGMAGSTAAVAAARLGLKVALVQDRPVLGGNTSSEVRVALGGQIHLPPYPALGGIVSEMDPGRQGNAQPAAQYDDERKLAVVKAEPNVRLFLNSRAHSVEMDGSRIKAVLARDVLSGQPLRLEAPLFADCTGDGNLGALAGADSRYGREAQSETAESMAPARADNLVMGTSVMWYSEDAGAPAAFPETPWALPFDEASEQKATRGDWDWETGQRLHQINDAERIRDHAFRAIYGNWAYQKNHAADRAKYANLKLSWVAYVGGKRESRRLLGDVILQEQDIVNQRPFPDAAVTATWSIDLHVPTDKNSELFPGQEFRSVASFGKKNPYAIPYRCFYSRNVENLFMAGRNISVTHVALGTVRVMRTTGMMGEAVGIAASLARRHETTPRGVYERHLPELQAALQRGAGKAALSEKPVPAPAGYQLAWSEDFNELDRNLWSIRAGSAPDGTRLANQVSLRDGALHLAVARVVASGSPDFTGAGLTRRSGLSHGYLEVRLRILAGRGWRTRVALGDAAFENRSEELTAFTAGAARVPTTPIYDFHTLAIESSPTAVRYLLDGVPVATAAAIAEPTELRLDVVAAEPARAASIDAGRLPSGVLIDSVKFYRR